MTEVYKKLIATAEAWARHIKVVEEFCKIIEETLGICDKPTAEQKKKALSRRLTVIVKVLISKSATDNKNNVEAAYASGVPP